MGRLRTCQKDPHRRQGAWKTTFQIRHWAPRRTRLPSGSLECKSWCRDQTRLELYLRPRPWLSRAHQRSQGEHPTPLQWPVLFRWRLRKSKRMQWSNFARRSPWLTPLLRLRLHPMSRSGLHKSWPHKRHRSQMNPVSWRPCNR